MVEMAWTSVLVFFVVATPRANGKKARPLFNPDSGKMTRRYRPVENDYGVPAIRVPKGPPRLNDASQQRKDRLGECPGFVDEWGGKKCFRSDMFFNERICAKVFENNAPRSRHLRWGRKGGDYWSAIGEGIWPKDAEIRKQHGDSTCVDMFLIADLIESQGCQSVHIRCEATDMAMVVRQYNNNDYFQAKRCLHKLCPDPTPLSWKWRGDTEASKEEFLPATNMLNPPDHLLTQAIRSGKADGSRGLMTASSSASIVQTGVQSRWSRPAGARVAWLGPSMRGHVAIMKMTAETVNSASHDIIPVVTCVVALIAVFASLRIAVATSHRRHNDEDGASAWCDGPLLIS